MGHGMLSRKEQPVLAFANPELYQSLPNLYQGANLTPVDWLIEPLPIDYSYAQSQEWTIS
jgi:hypothetical protein